MDPKDWSSLARPDPEWEEAVRVNLNGEEPDLGKFGNIHALKEHSLNARSQILSKIGGPPVDVVEQEISIPVRDGCFIPARIHRPAVQPPKGCALYIMLHGGGFCLGGLESETPHCRMLVQELGLMIVNVDYRLAPEFKFPVAANDSWDATKWIAKNAASLGADPSRGFIIGGTSAGANLVAGVVHLARDHNMTPRLTGTHYMIPSLCRAAFLPEKYRSLHNSETQNGNAPILSINARKMFAEAYVPDPEQRRVPLYSVILWETGHSGLAPSYFQVAGLDPLRDDGLLFEKILREEEKIETRLDVYPGQPHGFENEFKGMKASIKFRKDMVDGVRWLLER